MEVNYRNGLQKIKRVKLEKKKSSEIEEDEVFSEPETRISGNRKDATRDKGLEAFESQIKELNTRVKKFENTASVMRKTILQQSSDIENLLSQLSQIKEDGNRQFEVLFNELLIDQRNDAYVNEESPETNYAAVNEYQAGLEYSNQNASKLAQSNHETQDEFVFENLSRTAEDYPQQVPDHPREIWLKSK